MVPGLFSPDIFVSGAWANEHGMSRSAVKSIVVRRMFSPADEMRKLRGSGVCSYLRRLTDFFLADVFAAAFFLAGAFFFAARGFAFGADSSSSTSGVRPS